MKKNIKKIIMKKIIIKKSVKKLRQKVQDVERNQNQTIPLTAGMYQTDSISI